MRWLLFLSRLAFICGFFLILCFILQVSNWNIDEAITSTIIIIGYFIGLLVIPAVNICYLIVLIIRKTLLPVPLWLVVGNVIYLMLLIIYILLQNVQVYNS